MSSDVMELSLNLDKVREELAELEGLKPVRFVVSVANKPWKCCHCSNGIALGAEVLWVRTKDDDEFVPGTFLGGSTWKAKPWHRSCWDLWEFAVDLDRIRLEKILGEDHHELRSV